MNLNIERGSGKRFESGFVGDHKICKEESEKTGDSKLRDVGEEKNKNKNI